MIAAHAAWHMQQWDEMAVYVDTVDVPPPQGCSFTSDGSTTRGGPERSGLLAQTATGAFLRSVLCVRSRNYDAAKVRRRTAVWGGPVYIYTIFQFNCRHGCVRRACSPHTIAQASPTC
jgi:hypothetical protein